MNTIDNLLPKPESLLKLFYDRYYDEAKVVALHGVNLLTRMYAGRGGCLNPKKMIYEYVNILSAYLDTLYWIAIGKDDVSSALLLSHHLKGTDRYDKKGFDDIYSHVQKRISAVEIKVYKIYISCLWTTTKELYKNWSHLFENMVDVGDINLKSTLGYQDETSKITYILTESINEADYFVVIWGSQITLTEEQLKRTIFLRTEPLFPNQIKNGIQNIIDPLKFLRFYDYYDARYPNCAEYWLPNKPSSLLLHLNPKYLEDKRMSDGQPVDKSTMGHPNGKKLDCLSAIVSSKYVDEGHKYRVDLLKYIIGKYPAYRNNVHIYGFNNAHNFPSDMYKGSLPNYDKSKGLLDYKYTLAAENNAIKGYFTEKIIDGILAECLVFYWGCPNIKDYFQEVNGVLPYVLLPADLEQSCSIIFEHVAINSWESRISAIRETKRLILSKFMLRHRISLVLHEEIYLKLLGDDGFNILNLSKITHVGDVSKAHFPKILYNGSRYDNIKEMVDRSSEHKSKLIYFESLCDKIPDNTPFVQEFSNASSANSTISQYTVGYSRFSIKNFAFPKDQRPKTFVVNLERRSDRMKAFENRFPRVSLCGFSAWNFTRFNAIDGKEMAAKGFSEGIKYLFRDNDFSMKPAVVGCALSHIKLWQRLMDDKDNDHYLIFEDDVEFTDSYAWKLFSLMQNMIFSWDVLYLGHLVCYEQMQDHRLEGALPKWESMSNYITPKRTSWVGTASYMISKTGAEKLLRDIDVVGVTHGIDYFMQLRFGKSLRAYGARPMLNFAEYPSPLNPDIDVDTDIQK